MSPVCPECLPDRLATSEQLQCSLKTRVFDARGRAQTPGGLGPLPAGPTRLPSDTVQLPTGQAGWQAPVGGVLVPFA